MYQEVKVVCFGGGTGLPTLLSGLKHNPWLDITAVANMFDDGGSSRELKDRFGILPPGDLLKCLLALSKHEAYARELLLRRIKNHQYNGHTGGNVLLLGLEKVFGGIIPAVDACGQLLSIRGHVAPVTLTKSSLSAKYTDQTIHRGETSVDSGIMEGKVVEKLFLDPIVPASPQAVKAIEEADVFCIGPGSFYTSILPNFLPHGVAEALKANPAKIIYIANLLSEGKGMQGMRLEDIVERLEGAIGRRVDYVVVNHCWSSDDLLDRYAAENKYPIGSANTDHDPRFVIANLWRDKDIARHDCSRLAHLVSGLIHQCRPEF